MLDPARIQQVLAEAVELPFNQRSEFLDRACEGDSSLRAEVESLLRAHDGAGGFLAAPTIDLPNKPTTASHAESIGSVIDRYKLVQVLGEGGFGTVFLAEQTSPVRREVALKIIKLGMDTREVIGRFEAERQALAILDHPNVARVFDAGATQTGRPYFVMELVKGVPVTRYCDEHKLTPRERLELFVPICLAVQHAHQKGIIHRDLKPTNVLVSVVDDRPVPKIIDFGIAKATGARLTEKTVFTELRQMIGTPAYMSPEQADPGSTDIDTRSDIYSLGVLLYELLTGTTPIEEKNLRSAAYGEMQRMIREDEPPKPSTRISTMGDSLPSVAALRATEPKRLSRFVQGELDWIVMKCIEKDRTRRYDSAGSLAADLLRHLGGEAVLASPPSAVYQFRKFVGKHRAALTTAGIIVLALVAALIVALVSLREVTKQKNLALDSSDTSQQINKFLTDMLEAANPDKAKGRVVTVQETLDRAAARIGASFKDRPMIESGVRLTMGSAYSGMGRFDQALEHVRRSYELRKKEFGPRHRDTLIALARLANTTYNAGKWKEAEPLGKEAFEGLRDVCGASDKETLGAMATYIQTINLLAKWYDAEPLSNELIQLHRATGNRDRALVGALLCRARILFDLNRYADADPIVFEALELIRSIEGPDDPWAVNALTCYGTVMRHTGRLDEAEVHWNEALERSRRVYGPSSPFTLMAMNNLGVLLQTRSRHAEAEPIYRELRSQFLLTQGENNPNTLVAGLNLGASIMMQPGRIPDAIAIFEETAVKSERALGLDHPITISILTNTSMCYSAGGLWEHVVPLNKKIFDAMETAQVSDVERAEKTEWYGSALCLAKQYAEAEQPLMVAVKRCEKAGRAADGIASKAMFRLAEALENTARPDEAKQWRAKAIAATQPTSAQASSTQPTTTQR